MHENFMLHIVNNTGRIIKQCDASGKADVAAMMRVVQTYNLLNYTDAYGPVPFTSVFATAGDAFQPSSFAYDSQQEVYARMLEDLDSASRVSPPDRRTSRQRTTSGAGATRCSGPVWRTS